MDEVSSYVREDICIIHTYTQSESARSKSSCRYALVFRSRNKSKPTEIPISSSELLHELACSGNKDV
jgi:hypothetical protein